MSCKLRFAPSPTGYLHLGNARTALINWLYARAHGGEFVLRMDDTDLERSKDEYAQSIFEDMAWLGLNHDHFFKQSDRLKRYEGAAEELKSMGRLYPCYETSEELDLQRKIQLSSNRPPIYNRAALKLTDAEKEKYDAEGRQPHWRFKLDPGVVEWNDMVRGIVRYEGQHLSDPVLIRECGSPVYTLASVVDDKDTGITHILRGEDHVTNTAVQIQLLEALSGKPCTIQFGHTALVSGAQGEGLSKREGSQSLRELRFEGMEPMAINSLLARLGTSDAVEPSIDLRGLVETFDIQKFGRSTPKLDPQELWQMNAKILHMMPYDVIEKELKTLGLPEITPPFWSVIQGNCEKLQDVKSWWEICYGNISNSVEEVEFIDIALGLLPEDPWDNSTFQEWAGLLKGETGLKGKALFMLLRKALTGLDHGPELKDLILLMGRLKVSQRLKTAKN
ncbi:Glutamate--tRNA ligase 1 [Candidatus Bealeia paramacronuclearis]|uniref:Glutamate--tRNA ligase n=1 Tax=Candidatus Bealeia paramacronuclearis TaxID=1921001 RepID=A0ABZ2C3P7_9PROT|nr:Glutamate--tRNA ligase 1 [Candidatus Bealeia paramacronuclearis]